MKSRHVFFLLLALGSALFRLPGMATGGHTADLHAQPVERNAFASQDVPAGNGGMHWHVRQ